MPKIKEINGKIMLADGENTLEIKIAEDHTIFSSSTGKYTFTSDDESIPVEVTVGQNIITSEPTQPDWTQLDETEPDYIWTKPAIWPGEGANAILEGNIAENVASAIFSMASGTNTTATGNYSHAQGYHTTASGAQSHAECYYTEASGQSSHAEGTHTTAEGDNSHAEGVRTIAKHNCQHVFGKHNIADISANPPTQIGNFVEIVGNGADTDNRSNARTLDWEGNEVLAGTLTAGGDIISNGINITQAISGGGGGGVQIQSDWAQTTETSVNYILNKPAILSGAGTDSIIEGDLVQNIATGNYSHAEGYDTEAVGNYSHAEGMICVANGEAAHVEGRYCTADGAAAHAEGYYAEATGNYSHAEGSQCVATGAYSHAEGYATSAGISAHAEGSFTSAEGDMAHAEGLYTVANNRSQHVYGEYNIADPSTSSATARGTYVEIVGNGEVTAKSNARTLDWGGNEVLAGTLTAGGDIISNGVNLTEAIIGGGGSGQIQSNWLQNDGTAVNYILNRPSIQDGGGTNAIIEGDLAQNTATGNYSHAEGYYSSASGNNSHTEGSGTKAIGVQSHAEGSGTTASGADAHAEGSYTTASGDYSHAEGYTTTASGDYSHAEGSDTIASGDYSHAEGQATTANHKSQHVYGEYNIADPSPSTADARGNYVEIVGNGEYFTHSNARTLDWGGNEVLAGTLTAGGDVISNGVNLSEAISTAKLRVNGGSLQASIDGGTTWHTITFAD